jgi:molybdenum cofactor guanylyltransferase
MQSFSVSAYVLAGGRSSRMGRDKALLELGGKPLIEHMVGKLRQLSDHVSILSGSPELAGFAPLVPDLRESCGPLGGLEAALAHASRPWALVLPVDMPFLPVVLLRSWIANILQRTEARLALFVVDGVPQPTICLLHREVAPFLTTAAEQGRFKLYPVLDEAARSLAHRRSVPVEEVLVRTVWGEAEAEDLIRRQGQELTRGQRTASHLWFANLNTPEELREAEGHLDALGSELGL